MSLFVILSEVRGTKLNKLINPDEKPEVYCFSLARKRYGMFRLRMRTLLGGVAVPQSGIRCPTTAQHDKILKDLSKKTICQIKIYPLRFIFSSFLPTKKRSYSLLQKIIFYAFSYLRRLSAAFSSSFPICMCCGQTSSHFPHFLDCTEWLSQSA